MTIKFLCDYGPYKLNNTVTLTTSEESALVSAKVATTDLTGGVAYVAPDNSTYTTSVIALVDKATNKIKSLKNPDGSDASIGGVSKNAITSTRPTSLSDDQSIAGNNTANNYTLTVAADTLPNGAIFQQLSAGTVTVAPGAGVTFIGPTLATSSAGQAISIMPTPIANTFIVKVA